MGTDDMPDARLWKGVDSQVEVAARDMDAVQKGQPQWLWFENGIMCLSFGRWCADPVQAPYIRADIAMQAAMAGRGVRVKALEAALRSVRAAIMDAARFEVGIIVDTLWMHDSPSETVIDFIDAALEPAGAQEGAEECPYPVNGKTIGTPASVCIAAGECGCVHGVTTEPSRIAVMAATLQAVAEEGVFVPESTTPAPDADVAGLVERLGNQANTLRQGLNMIGASPRAFAEALIGALTEAASALTALQAEVARLERGAYQGAYNAGYHARIVDTDRDGVVRDAEARATAAEAEAAALRAEVNAAREFVKRHPALSLIDLAEFEAFLKMPGAIEAALSAREG